MSNYRTKFNKNDLKFNDNFKSYIIFKRTKKTLILLIILSILNSMTITLEGFMIFLLMLRLFEYKIFLKKNYFYIFSVFGATKNDDQRKSFSV